MNRELDRLEQEYSYEKRKVLHAWNGLSLPNKQLVMDDVQRWCCMHRVPHGVRLFAPANIASHAALPHRIWALFGKPSNDAPINYDVPARMALAGFDMSGVEITEG